MDQSVRCSSCKKPGHSAGDCWFLKSFCSACRKPGHTIVTCAEWREEDGSVLACHACGYLLPGTSTLCLKCGGAVDERSRRVTVDITASRAREGATRSVNTAERAVISFCVAYLTCTGPRYIEDLARVVPARHRAIAPIRESLFDPAKFWVLGVPHKGVLVGLQGQAKKPWTAWSFSTDPGWATEVNRRIAKEARASGGEVRADKYGRKFVHFADRRLRKRSLSPTEVVCRSCGGRGHYANTCPLPRRRQARLEPRSFPPDKASTNGDTTEDRRSSRAGLARRRSRSPASSLKRSKAGDSRDCSPRPRARSSFRSRSPGRSRKRPSRSPRPRGRSRPGSRSPSRSQKRSRPSPVKPLDTAVPGLLGGNLAEEGEIVAEGGDPGPSRSMVSLTAEEISALERLLCEARGLGSGPRPETQWFLDTVLR